MDHRARAGAEVIAFAVDTGAPCHRPPEFHARKGYGEDLRAHEVLRHRLCRQFALDTEVAEDFHGPLVGNVRPWTIGGAGIFGDGDRVDAGASQQRRRRQPRGSRTHHKHVCFDCLHPGLSGASHPYGNPMDSAEVRE